MKEVLVFTYSPQAPADLGDRVATIMKVCGLPFIHYNIPQTKPAEVIRDRDVYLAILTFGQTAHTLIKEVIPPTTRVIELPTLTALEPKKGNEVHRQGAFEKLKALKGLLEAPPSLVSGEVTIPELSLEKALGILQEASQNKVAYTIPHANGTLEITNTTPSGLSDIYMTPFDVCMLRLLQETLGAQIVTIERKDK